MDTKNVIAAISMSAAVIILYSLFFAPPPITKEQLAEKNKTEQNSDAPSLDQKETVTEITREEALSQNKRIQFENQSIFGTISLKGAIIDDLTFKNILIAKPKINFGIRCFYPFQAKEDYGDVMTIEIPKKKMLDIILFVFELYLHIPMHLPTIHL